MNELKEIGKAALVNAREVVEKNKELVEQAYHLIMHLEEVSHRYGLLALDEAIGYCPKDVPLCEEVTELINMVIHGMEAEYISELAYIKFEENEYRGIEAFLYYLYVRSILLIQAGEIPYRLELFINTMIPGDILKFEEQQKIQSEEKEKKLRELKTGLSDLGKSALQKFSDKLMTLSEEEWKVVVSSNGFVGWEMLLPLLEKEVQELVAAHMNPYRYREIIGNSMAVSEDKMLELLCEAENLLYSMRSPAVHNSILEPVLECTDEEIQKSLREIGSLTLAMALKRERAEIVDAFMRNLSVKLSYMIREDIDCMGPVRMCDVEDAQRKIMQIIEKIRSDRSGEHAI